MATAHVQSGGALANNATSVSDAFGSNITSGNDIFVAGMTYCPSSDAFVAGDVTKTAGTATIGTLSIAGDVQVAYDGDNNHVKSAIWRARVTGTGSCTMTQASVAGSYLLIGDAEFSGLADAIAEDSDTGSQTTNDTSPAISTAVTTAGAGVIIGALAIADTADVTITAQAAFTSMYENENGSDDGMGSFVYQIVGSGTTDAPEWTVGNNDGWCVSAAAFAEAAAAGGTILPQMMHLMGY